MSLRGGELPPKQSPVNRNPKTHSEIASLDEPSSQRHANERKITMQEFLNILKDIKSGALPASELPGFIAWWLGKVYWLGLAVVIILGTWLVRKQR